MIENLEKNYENNLRAISYYRPSQDILKVTEDGKIVRVQRTRLNRLKASLSKAFGYKTYSLVHIIETIEAVAYPKLISNERVVEGKKILSSFKYFPRKLYEEGLEKLISPITYKDSIKKISDLANVAKEALKLAERAKVQQNKIKPEKVTSNFNEFLGGKSIMQKLYEICPHLGPKDSSEPTTSITTPMLFRG